MADQHHKGGISFYIIIALVLGGLTYFEFAIVEYPVAWLSSAGVIAALVIMSLLKFALVVAIYMHLRDDDPIYTGFFSSGMVIAIGTFIALSFLFTVRSAVNVQNVQAQEVPDLHAEEGHAEIILTERSLSEQLRAPEPKTQRVRVPLPTSPEPSYTLLSSGSTAFLAGAPAASESTAATELAASQAEVFDWQALGEATYGANCVACHQADGAGIPGAFPPLAGHLPELYRAEGGRAYLVNVVLYGLQGQIEVDGTSYNGVMTPWAQLSDEQIAATLNHELSSWGNAELLEDFAPLLPEEVAAERGKGLSGAEVLSLRPELP